MQGVRVGKLRITSVSCFPTLISAIPIISTLIACIPQIKVGMRGIGGGDEGKQGENLRIGVEMMNK